jgi:hypothetical protein
VSDHAEARRLVRLRLEELPAEQRRLSRLLVLYQSYSHVAVLLGIVVPVLAGSGLVSTGGLLADHKQLLAIAVVVTAMLTALHKGLNCEAYHAGCRRAVNTLQSLVDGYEAVGASPDPGAAVADLETRLRQFRESAFDIPPVRQRQRALGAAAP